MDCVICGLPSNGNHFGVQSCRACAAFFRRGAFRRAFHKCKKQEKCEKSIFGGFSCKKCRMKKCLALGMDVKKFQFGRDKLAIQHFYTENDPVLTPKYINIFESSSGRPYIDLKLLLKRAEQILSKSWSSTHPGSSLEKLSIGLNSIRELPDSSNFPKKCNYVGKLEKLIDWEDCFLKTATWLTYFDEFQVLPIDIKMKFLNTIWHVFIEFDKLLINASGRKRGVLNDMMLIPFYNSFVDFNDVTYDIGWFTDKNRENIKFYLDDIDWNMLSFIKPLMELDPDDIEMTFMACLLSFNYAGKRHQREILKISEKIQEKLANDLHNYYNNQNLERYSGRLSQLMKFVRSIEKEHLEKMWKVDLGILFNVYKLDFSHPEVFKDNFV